MDQDNNQADIAHKPPPLNSDQLNFLIWRYLQESGYGEAAVKLQRDWKVDVNSLSFAPRIHKQALIKLVQQGLKYYHLSQTFDENGQQTKPLTPGMFYFGPESAGSTSTVIQKEQLLKVPDTTRGVSPASTTATSSKLRARDTTSAAPEDTAIPTIKRGRKSAQSVTADRNGVNSRKASGGLGDGETNGNGQQNLDRASPTTGEASAGHNVVAGGNQDDKMDIDQDGPSENVDVAMDDVNDIAAQTLVATIDNGTSTGVQSESVKETNLHATTAILGLSTSQNINKVMWQPSDADTLVIQSETSCSYWDLRGQNLQPGSVKPLPTSLCSTDPDSLITSASWDADGTILAVATLSGGEGQINLYEGQDLNFVESLPASQRALTLLKWHPTSAKLIGVSPDVEDRGEKAGPTSTLLCWDLTGSSGASEPGVLRLPCSVLDTDFGDGHLEGETFIAGENTVLRCSSIPNGMKIEQSWSSPREQEAEVWTFIRCAQRHHQESILIAVAAETASIWLPQQQIYHTNAHQAPITALEMKPKPGNINGSYPRTQFSTSSDDGVIKVWEIQHDGTNVNCIHQLRFDPVGPIMSIAYSPDGSCLSGAGYASVRIWTTQHYNLTARWDGTDSEWRGANIRDDEIASKASDNGENSPSASQSLSWHSDSRRLAFGLGTQVAVINFQR